MRVQSKKGNYGPGHLYPLSELDEFEVEDKDVNVAGWEVTGGDGKKIGKVDELIVDPGAMKVRYLLVEVDEDVSMIDGDHYIMIPIGAATLMKDHDVVLLKDLSVASVNSYPIYDHTGTSIIREYEKNIRSFYTKDAIPEDDLDFYSHELYNDRGFYRRNDLD